MGAIEAFKHHLCCHVGLHSRTGKVWADIVTGAAAFTPLRGAHPWLRYRTGMWRAADAAAVSQTLQLCRPELLTSGGLPLCRGSCLWWSLPTAGTSDRDTSSLHSSTPTTELQRPR